MYENKIRLLTGEMFIEHYKIGRNAYYIFENNKVFSGNEIRKTEIEIMCNGMLIWFKRPYRQSFLIKKWFSNKYYANECNPWVGRFHSNETKEKQSNVKKGMYDGEKNPFYGKTHLDETKEKLKILCGRAGEKNPFYGKAHSDETKRILSEKSKQWTIDHPVEMKQRGIKSVQSQLGKKSSIEIKVENKLKELNVIFKYSKIINEFQYDFIIGDDILLEVQGN